MVHLLLEDYASKRNKILKDPKFLELYGKYTQGIFGGAHRLPKETFIDNIAKAFDPTYNVTVNPQTNALNGDSRYLDFIFTNLYSGNITPDQANVAHEALNAYRLQTSRNNPQISKDLQSYKVFFPDEAIKDRQGETLPGLIKAMEEYTRVYDFNATVHTNLQKTLAAFQDNNIDEVYANSMYKFFRIDAVDAAKIMMGNRDPDMDPEFFTSGRSERCSGYWCLPRMPSYFPCWVAVDVYGFMDYAFAPKPGANYSGPEIKNRFNHNDSVCKMSPASYEAVLDFFQNYGAQDPRVINSFKTSFLRIGSGNALRNYGSPKPGGYHYDDYIKFLVRLPNLDVIYRLTNERFSSNISFATRICGISPTGITETTGYQDKVGLGLKDLHDYYPGKKVISFAPLFKSIENMHGTSLTDTDFSYNKYVARFIPSLIDDFKQSFVQDTDLLADGARGYEVLNDFIVKKLPTIHHYREEFAKKIATQITKLLEQERLYFDATTDVKKLDAVAKSIKTLSQSAQYRPYFDEYTQLVETLKDSFAYYMSMGGAFNWTDEEGTIAASPNVLDSFAEYIENSTIENKQKLFDAYAQSMYNKLTGYNAQEITAAAFTKLFDIAAKMNLPRETSIKKIISTLEKGIARKSSSAITNIARQVLNDEEIKTYINQNKKYINKIAPHFAQLLAIIDPKSDFGKMYPKIAKFRLSQRYTNREQRIKFYNDLKALSTDGYINNRPEFTLGNNNAPVIRTLGESYMVPATVENIQKVISLRGNGYSAKDFQQMLPNLAMLINAGFKPRHLFFNFQDSLNNVQAKIRSKRFDLPGMTILVGDFNGKTIATNEEGIIYFLDNAGALVLTRSFGEFQEMQQQALFDHHKPKPKQGFYGLFERVNSFAIK